MEEHHELSQVWEHVRLICGAQCLSLISAITCFSMIMNIKCCLAFLFIECFLNLYSTEETTYKVTL